MNRHIRTGGKIAQIVFVGIVAGSMISCSTFSPENESSTVNYQAKEPFSLGYAVGEEGHFEMYGVNGTIDIAGVEEATTIYIWGERMVKSESPEDAAEHIEDITFDVQQGRYRIVFETSMPSDPSGREYAVVYHVRVPMGWSVSINHMNGSIEAASMNSAIDIDLASGDVNLDELAGDVNVEVSNGTIAGDVLLTHGEICDLDITNGDIDLGIPEDLSAILTAGVVNGTVDVSELRMDDQNAAVDEVCGCLGDGEKTVDLSAVNGTIRVRCR